MAETNLHWPSTSTQQQIQERTRGWFETTVSAAACNKHNTRVPNQQGGAAILAREQFAHRCFTRGYDSLGRWIVLSFRGKDGLALRVVSAYRPIPGSGPYTVYQQQINYFSTIGNTKCSITNYDNDLITLIELDRLEQILLMVYLGPAHFLYKKLVMARSLGFRTTDLHGWI